MILRKLPLFFLSVFSILLIKAQFVLAQGVAQPLTLDALTRSGNFSTSITLILSLGMITLIPFFLISTTCFLRVVIVLSMIRQALGTQQAPPNMVIVSLAIFISIFVMSPTLEEIRTTAYTPYKEGRITQIDAVNLGIKPIHKFMIKFTRDKDLGLFMEFSQTKFTGNKEAIPIFVLIPAFILSELKTSFQIGFLLFIPFVVIDLVVSNILLSLGMFMLSPAMISLPFKILLFVLTDGWNLIVQGLLLSFR